MIHKIGFILAEKFNFSSAKKINSLFASILKVCPFSKKEAKTYDDLLRDRNLIVHHHGTYTLTYLQQAKIITENQKDRAFFDSLVITNEYILDKVDFISDISYKLLKSSEIAIKEYLATHVTSLNEERENALKMMLWWE